ncbi:conserved putative membrane protein [Candidatus Protochlamydia naegleriophila]|uniref:Conserved putative membrane protein n=1 Tax=Candidatus Protochlamydia naegleriophila TaxID=389348 RepID=A0A0U5ESG2_9BACT|nr:hypothetical protein [Candidatus Protochlamydia naegleriophila]CUI17136.1 conserved putative membrane protein [Candidatus Protochlamydia naegleriophila]
MIEAIRYYGSHTILDTITEAVSAVISTIVNAVDATINRIAVQIIMTTPLFYLHHNLFTLGFVIGFVFDRQVREVVEKVNVVYNAQRSFIERVLFIGGGSVLALLTMPTSIVIATLYYSAKWGALLYTRSRQQQIPQGV